MWKVDSMIGLILWGCSVLIVCVILFCVVVIIGLVLLVLLLFGFCVFSMWKCSRWLVWVGKLICCVFCCRVRWLCLIGLFYLLLLLFR